MGQNTIRTGPEPNYPLMQDGSETPIKSPKTTTETLIIPDNACTFEIWCTSGNVTAQMYKDTVAQTGDVGIGTARRVFPVHGCWSTVVGFPNKIVVTTAGSEYNFFFGAN